MNLSNLIPPTTVIHTTESANAMDDLWQSCLQAADASDDDVRDRLLHEFDVTATLLIEKYGGDYRLHNKLSRLRSDAGMTEDMEERILNLILMKTVAELAIFGSLLNTEDQG